MLYQEVDSFLLVISDLISRPWCFLRAVCGNQREKLGICAQYSSPHSVKHEFKKFDDQSGLNTVLIQSSRPQTDIFDTMNTTTFTPTPNMFTQGYVEWYWVVLGLVIPILLGALFCIMDHLRRRKMNKHQNTEAALESICERNKHAPPSYEDVLPNLFIDNVPIWNDVNFTHIQSWVEIEARRATESHQQAPAEGACTEGNPELQVIQADGVSHASGSKTVNAIEHSEESDIPEPPAYEECHKYEVYGSKAPLVS